MLVAPHQFNSSDFSAFQNMLTPWGAVLLALGLAVIAHAVYGFGGWLHLAVYGSGALILILQSYTYYTSRSWIWLINSSIMALALLLCALAANASPSTKEPKPVALDAFALLAGLAALLTGLLYLIVPDALREERFNLIRPLAPAAGLLLLSGGAALLGVQVLPRDHPNRSAVNGFVGVIFLAYVLIVHFPVRFWPGFIFYTLMAAVLLFSLILRSTPLFSPSSLRMRLALLLSATMAVPLIITVSIISGQEEASVKAEVLNRQQSEAATLAQSVAEYISLHRAMLETLASSSSLLTLSPEDLSAQLDKVSAGYPDISALAVYDREGRLVARSDGGPDLTISGSPVFEQARLTGSPSREILVSPSLGKPIFSFGTPVNDSEGVFQGVLVLFMNSSRVARFLSGRNPGGGSLTYLVNENGRVIAHPYTNLVSEFADLSEKAPVSRLLKGEVTAGQVDYFDNSTRMLAGYAVVPQLGWGVVVEQVAPAALETVYQGRETAFGILLLFVLLTSGAGILAATWIVNPILTLQQAAAQMGAGQNHIPLPRTKILEIQSLAEMFGEMRRRLDERTEERERAQAALRQANEVLEVRVLERTADLQIANRELQDFAYIASHDLQEPLRKIRAFSSRLADKLSGSLDEESSDYLRRMEKAATRMQDMIEALLAYSRVTTRAQPLQPVNLEDVAREVIADLELRIEQTGGQVQLSPLPIIRADRLQMHQLLQNLISNALKYHRPESPPQVKVYSRAVVEPVSGEPKVEICVEDNGIGFDEKYLDRIFQPFQRLISRSEYEGSGIGLAICRKIAERHNGSITAASSPGQGSIFITTLPLQSSQKENKEKETRTG